MSEQLTVQQKQAVYGRGSSLLVSAGAGSGKTFVLVERLLGRILDRDDPCNIDDFLIVTYTRAAASELRKKIIDKLTERIILEPESRRLREQMNRVHGANISTAHSYFSSVIREFAPRLGLSPSFRIPDENESAALLMRTLDRLLEDKYEEADESFLLLANTIGAERSGDEALVSVVLSLQKTLESVPDPQKWLQDQRELLTAGDTDLLATEWGKAAKRELASFCMAAAANTEKWLNIISEDENLYKGHGPALADDIEKFGSVSEAIGDGCSWDELRALTGFSFQKYGTVRNALDPELKDAESAARDTRKKRFAEKIKFLSLDAAEVKTDMELMASALVPLLDLTGELADRFMKEKQARNLMTYSDLEQMALRLTEDEEIACELSSRFKEVLVDEYQDTNEVQDTLFRRLSDDGRKLFMVGDVKQSIYRFRRAEPDIFLNKYNNFVPFTEDETADRRIDLNANFRSDSDLLRFVNFVFGSVMRPRVGGLYYTKSEELRKLEPVPSPSVSVTVAFFDKKAAKSRSSDEEDVSTLEAEWVAREISALLKTGIETPAGHRDVKPGEIAILMPSVKTRSAPFAEALSRYGIDTCSESDDDLFESAEVRLLLSLLRIIDNPRQDLPLINVLHSPLFGFTAEELAQIRLAGKDMLMYEALIEKAKDDPRCASFLDFLGEMRTQSAGQAAAEVIWEVFCRTSIREIYSAMPNGRTRRKNLDSIMELARGLDDGNGSSLFSFLLFIEQAIKRSMPLKAAGSPADSVKFVTIHKSKGLEYPVVFLADTGKQFNNRDTFSPVMISKKLGVASRIVDRKLMVSYDTPARAVMAAAEKAESVSEQMRVLYVAMTRAKHRLYITMAPTYGESELRKCAGLLPAPGYELEAVGYMGKWVLYALLQGKGSCAADELIGKGALSGDTWELLYFDSPAEEAVTPALPAETAKPESPLIDLTDVLSWRYPRTGAENVPSKLTATQLKKEQPDGEEFPRPVRSASRLERPRFITSSTGLDPRERGTATHMVMQYIDFSKCADIDGIRGEIERLVALEQLTRDQADSVDAGRILRFFQTEPGRRLAAGTDKALREFKFSLLCPASDYYPEAAAEDEILLQGVVDVCIEGESSFTVLDFKTDHVTAETQEARARHYAPQVRAYGKALSRITGKKAEKLLLYFFSTGKFSEITP